MPRKWPEVEQSPEYSQLPVPEQLKAKQQYFDSVVTAKPEYSSLPDQEKTAAKQQFLGDFEDKSVGEEGKKPSFQSEVIGPITNAASALAFDVPRTAMKMQINRGEPGAEQAYDALYPEQQTGFGKALRFGLEAPATVFGGAGKLATKAFTKTSEVVGKKLLGKVASGVASGAAFGAATAKPTADEYGKNIVSNTVGGAVLPLAGEALSKSLNSIAKANPTGRMNEMTKALSSLNNAYQQGVKYIYENGKKIEVSNPIKTLVDRKLTPIVENGKANTTHIVEHLDNEVDGLAQSYREQIEPGHTIPLETFKNHVLSGIKNSEELQTAGAVSSTLKKVEGMLNDYQATYGDDIPLSKIDDIRMTMNKRFDPELRDANRAVGDASRKILYDALPGSKETLAKEGELLAARRFAETMNNKVVKGGRLGNYFAQVLGAVIGTKVDAGIPIAGPILGAFGGDLVRKGLQKSYFSGNPLSGAASKSLKFADALKGALFGKPAVEGEAITPEILPPEVRSMPNQFDKPQIGYQGAPLGLPNLSTEGFGNYSRWKPIPSESVGEPIKGQPPYFGSNLPIPSPQPRVAPTAAEMAKQMKMKAKGQILRSENGLVQPEAIVEKPTRGQNPNQLSGGTDKPITSEFNPLNRGNAVNPKGLIAPALIGGAMMFGGQAQASEPIKAGAELSGKASTYGWGEKLNPSTFSGERFNSKGITVAMRGVPMGTKVEVTDPRTGNKVEATVNDGGPAKKTGRIIDLSQGAWKALGYGKPGLLDAKIKILSLGKGRSYNGRK